MLEMFSSRPCNVLLYLATALVHGAIYILFGMPWYVIASSHCDVALILVLPHPALLINKNVATQLIDTFCIKIMICYILKRHDAEAHLGLGRQSKVLLLGSHYISHCEHSTD